MREALERNTWHAAGARARPLHSDAFSPIPCNPRGIAAWQPAGLCRVGEGSEHTHVGHGGAIGGVPVAHAGGAVRTRAVCWRCPRCWVWSPALAYVIKGRLRMAMALRGLSSPTTPTQNMSTRVWQQPANGHALATLADLCPFGATFQTQPPPPHPATYQPTSTSGFAIYTHTSACAHTAFGNGGE